MAHQAPPSASARVFNLPELLETILLEVSKLDRGDIYLNPATDLFVLQRVNKTFQSVIARNKSLRRRMFLEPFESGTTNLKPWHTAKWLVSTVGISMDGYRLCGVPSRYNSLTLRPPGKEQPFCKTTDASWRNMKICCVEKERGIEFGFGESTSRLMLSTDAVSWENVTLGKIHDGLMLLMPDLIEYWRAQEMHKAVSANSRQRDYVQHLEERVYDSEMRIRQVCARGDIWI